MCAQWSSREELSPFSPTKRSPVLIPPCPPSPPVHRERGRPVPQDADQPLRPAHPGERSQRPEGGLDQRPAVPGRVLPLAVRAHLGLVADEQNGQEEDTELQEWRGKVIRLFLSLRPCFFSTLLTGSLAPGMAGLRVGSVSFFPRQVPGS